MGLAVLLAGAAVLGGTPGWYLFLAGVLAWVELIALRAAGLLPARRVPASGRIPAVRQAVRGVEP